MQYDRVFHYRELDEWVANLNRPPRPCLSGLTASAAFVRRLTALRSARGDGIMRRAGQEAA